MVLWAPLMYGIWYSIWAALIDRSSLRVGVQTSVLVVVMWSQQRGRHRRRNTMHRPPAAGVSLSP